MIEPRAQREVAAARLPRSGETRGTAAPGFAANDSFIAFAHAVLERGAKELAANRPKSARAPTPDEIHQLRVAARRLRVALRLFGRMLPSKDGVRLNAELRWFAGSLGDIRDLEGCEAQFRAAYLMGCVGAWSLHPAQIEIAKRVFSPDPEEVAFARRVLEAIPDGRGVGMLDGKMQDDATWKQAKVMVDLADMLTSLHGAALMTYHAAGAIDRRRPSAREAAMAKLCASEMAVRLTDEATRIFASYGLAMEYPAQRYFRDARFLLPGGGTSEMLRLVIARELDWDRAQVFA